VIFKSKTFFAISSQTFLAISVFVPDFSSFKSENEVRVTQETSSISCA
jgi:hypothetical protein